MNIGIISDTHGSLTAWKLAYEKFFEEVELIIHCGDVLYHGPRNPLPDGYDPKSLAKELNSLQKPLIIVRGNCDAEVDQMVLEYPLESPYAHVITPEVKILVHHGHSYSPEKLPFRANNLYNIIISGHTHVPEIRQDKDLIYLNPGSPALPKNDTGTPTVALIDNKAIKIFHVMTGQLLESTILEPAGSKTPLSHSNM
jgi:putative phosphoesterase